MKNVILDDILFQAECGKLMGASTYRAKIPTSAYEIIIKEFDRMKIGYSYKGVETAAYMKEPHMLYDIVLPKEHDCGGTL